LALILTGRKRWIEFNAMSDDKRPRTGWFLNLRISGSISTNKMEKVVSWNVGPHVYKGGKEEIHQIFEQGPFIICLQDVRIPKKKEKFCQKRTPTGVSPLMDLHNHSPESKKRLQRSSIRIFGSDSTSLGLLSQSHTNEMPSF